MKLVKRTTKDIIGDYIDNENYIDYLEKTEETDSESYSLKLKRYEDSRKALELEVRNKIDKVDYVVLEVKRKEHLIDAEVDALKTEIDRLKQRKHSINRFRDFVNKTLLPMVIEEVGNEDGVWETDVARYKLYETYGAVDVNPEVCSKDFIKVEIKESIDRVKARNAAISADKNNKPMPDGIEIRKVQRVRRS